jgi:hypothetical protein
VDQDCNFVGEKMSTAMTPFRWKNCFADVQAGKHDITIRSFLDDVIVPALETLDRRIDELGRSNSPGHEFAQADMEDVLRETKMAFSLSLDPIDLGATAKSLSGRVRERVAAAHACGHQSRESRLEGSAETIP